MKRYLILAFSVLCFLILTACGDGGGGGGNTGGGTVGNENVGDGNGGGNSAPVANAGPNQNVASGSLVALNGSASSDADNDLITYRWSFVSMPTGSTATLSDSTVVNPLFTADIIGSYVLSLVVNDGTSDSASDTVTVSVSNTPVANAGVNQNIEPISLVTLDGSGSYDPDGDLITYTWSFVSLPTGSSAALSDNMVVNPSFTADVIGSYVLSLVVNDGTSDSVSDTVTISVSNTPVANAGVNQNIATGSLVTLDGNSSYDPDGDPLTYSWSFVSMPTGSSVTLSDEAIVNPSFTADMTGSYVLSLVVNDGTSDSSADTVTVAVSTTPVANAGPDQNVSARTLVTLDGSGSYDSDDDLITFAWSFVSIPTGSSAALSDSTLVNPTFTADIAGSYVLSLVVNDDISESLSDTVTVTAEAPIPTILAAGLLGPTGIAIDSTSVYWTEYDGGIIKKLGTNGGTVSALASGLFSPNSIAVDSTNVYWTEYGGGTIKKVGLEGGTVTTLASGLNYPRSIAVDSSSVYWTEYNGGFVKKVGLKGGTVTTLASGLNYPNSIAVDSTSVYWTEIDSVKKVGINGGTVTTLASISSSSYSIAVDSTSVYWTDYAGGRIKKVGTNGGIVTALISNLSNPHSIAVDSTSIYWTEYTGGTVKKMEKDGYSATTLASGLTAPLSIAVDSTSVYWTEYYIGGTIKKIIK